MKKNKALIGMVLGFVIVVGLFIVLTVLTNISISKKLEGNPYGRSDLKAETINILDDPNYQNIILPEELDDLLANGADMYVYYFSPTCPACIQASPVIKQVSDEMGVDVKQFNLLEFDNGFLHYNVDRTPTLVAYKDGLEYQRMVGSTDNFVEDLEEFFSLLEE